MKSLWALPLVVLAAVYVNASGSEEEQTTPQVERGASNPTGNDEPYTYPCYCVIEPYAGGMLADYHDDVGHCSESTLVWISSTTENYPQYCDSGIGLPPDQDCDCERIYKEPDDSPAPTSLYNRPFPPHCDPQDCVDGVARHATQRVHDIIHLHMMDDNGTEVAKFASTQLLFTPRDIGRPQDRLKPPVLFWAAVEISDFPENASPRILSPKSGDYLKDDQYQQVEIDGKVLPGQYRAKLGIPSRPLVLLLQPQSKRAAPVRQQSPQEVTPK